MSAPELAGMRPCRTAHENPGDGPSPDAGGETPETGTPLTRSLSPSSDGGVSAADRSERAPSRRHGRKKSGTSAESADAGVANADAPEADDLSTEAGERSSRILGGQAKGVKPKTVRPVGRFQACPVRVVGLSQAPFGVNDLCSPGFLGSGENKSFFDRDVIKVLAAPPEKHRRLLETAKRLPEILMSADPPLANAAELYGSLALMTESTHGDQDGPVCYVNGQSDVDFVVDMRKEIAPYAIVKHLCSKDNWKLVGQVQVHKFSSTQFTLLGSFEEAEGKQPSEKVYLDLTCIESPLQFKRFRKRQEAFRKVFLQTRSLLEGKFGSEGVLAFDAYIHLLKAFAAKVPHSAISVYQATCIGLFTLKIGHFRLKRSMSLAHCFFEGFLRFCYQFYSDPDTPLSICDTAVGYRRQSIDMSSARLLPRESTSWRSELYFRSVEVQQLSTRPDEWMNVTHSLDPPQVSSEALKFLEMSFPVDETTCSPEWDRF